MSNEDDKTVLAFQLLSLEHLVKTIQEQMNERTIGGFLEAQELIRRAQVALTVVDDVAKTELILCGHVIDYDTEWDQIPNQE